MRNITSAFGVFILITLTVTSCKKDTSQSNVNLPANAAPATSFAWNAINFTAARVITSENYNETQYNCEGTKNVFSISNTKGNGQQFTVGCAGGLIGSTQYAQANFSEVRLLCNLDALHYSGGCVIPVPTPFSTGYSDTIIFGSTNTWALYHGDTLQWSYSDSANVPAIADIVSGEAISTTGSYSLTALGNVSGDSVIFSITGPLSQVSHVLGANATSCSFTSAEMASLGTTGGVKSGLLQIAPYNFSTRAMNGVHCYFIKETCLSKYVVLQ